MTPERNALRAIVESVNVTDLVHNVRVNASFISEFWEEEIIRVCAEVDNLRDEIERLRQLVREAHALDYARGLCSCGWLPVDLRDGNANYSWGCPDDWRIEHAAHVEELLNGVTE